MNHAQQSRSLPWLTTILLLLASFACKTPPMGESAIRIAGGVPFTPPSKKFPLARLSITRDDGTYSCSGVFISTRHILTAAHCLTDRETRQPLSSTKVVVKSHYADVLEIIIDQNYVTQSFTRGHPNDLGIVFIQQPPGEPSPEPVDIAEKAPPVGARIELLGYGFTSRNASSLPSLPRRGWNHVESVTDGFIYFPTPTTTNHSGDAPSEGDATESGSLKGDSGGPLLQDGKLVGICIGGDHGLGGSWASIIHSRNYYLNINGQAARNFLSSLQLQ